MRRPSRFKFFCPELCLGSENTFKAKEKVNWRLELLLLFPMKNLWPLNSWGLMYLCICGPVNSWGFMFLCIRGHVNPC